MLITVEGIDGSGKSAACSALCEAFPEAVMTREPTDSWYGDAVRRSIRTDDADPLAELFLYTADHAHHLAAVIRPALDDGSLVISDRYSDSRYAYQGHTLADHVPDSISFVQSIHEPWTRPPDYTIYLDVPPSVGANRSGATNKFEREAELAAIADNYEQLIARDPSRFHRVDGMESQTSVAETVITLVSAMCSSEC